MVIEQAAGQDSHLSIRRVTFAIDNLSWGGGGSLLIERVILRMNGVRHAYVNPATEMAYVEYDAFRCSPEQLTAAIEQAGFRTGAPAAR